MRGSPPGRGTAFLKNAGDRYKRHAARIDMVSCYKCGDLHTNLSGHYVSVGVCSYYATRTDPPKVILPRVRRINDAYYENISSDATKERNSLYSSCVSPRRFVLPSLLPYCSICSFGWRLLKPTLSRLRFYTTAPSNSPPFYGARVRVFYSNRSGLNHTQLRGGHLF